MGSEDGGREYEFSQDVIDWIKRTRRSNPDYENYKTIILYMVEISNFERTNRISKMQFYQAQATFEAGIASILIKNFGSDGFGNKTVQPYNPPTSWIQD